MLTQHEYLARERKHEVERRALEARDVRLARALSSQRRWHRVARYAQAVERRYARRAHRSTAR